MAAEANISINRCSIHLEKNSILNAFLDPTRVHCEYHARVVLTHYLHPSRKLKAISSDFQDSAFGSYTVAMPDYDFQIPLVAAVFHLQILRN